MSVGGGKGALVYPNLVVTHGHMLRRDAAPGMEGKAAFVAFTDPIFRLVRDEHTRRARLVCFSPLNRADYAIWELLEEPPEGVEPLRTTDRLDLIRWVGTFRAYFTGTLQRQSPVSPEYPQVLVPGRNPIPGWSGTPLLTDRGELAGLVSRVDPTGYVYPTIPRWWTCHTRR
jgi:hypothetical protein